MAVGGWLMAESVGDSWVVAVTWFGIVDGLTLIVRRGTVLLRSEGITGTAGFGTVNPVSGCVSGGTM